MVQTATQATAQAATKTTNSPAQIKVVGAGFVGLTFALSAAQHGFTVELVDRKSAPTLSTELSSNVLALNVTSSDLLSELNVWQNIADQHKTSYDSMHVFDGEGAGDIAFTAADADLDRLGSIVDQNALLIALNDQAGGQPNITLSWETDAEVSLGDAPLLVAADGIHSNIRKAIGLRTIAYSYHQSATVCWAKMGGAHGNQARQWFQEAGPLALLPMADPQTVAIVWSNFEALDQLGEESFAELLLEATEEQLGQVLAIGPRFAFPLMQQQALQYVAKGVALLGDAAHAIHPLAGQGANLGLADAQALVTELASARLEGREPGDLTVLKRYERARRSDNHLAGLAMEGLHRLFTSRLPAIALLRSQGLRLVNANKPLKRFAISVASGRL